MGIEFSTLQRKTLTAIVDTFVAAVPREDDPTGFYAAKGSDVGADVATEQYLAHPPARRAARRPAPTARRRRPLIGLKNQPQAVARGDRRQPRGHLARDGRGDRRAVSAFGDVRLQPARPGGPQPACGPAWDIRARSRPRRRRRKTLEVITAVRRDDARGGCRRGRLRQRRRGRRRGAGAGRQAGHHPGGRRLFQRIRLRPVGTRWRIRTFSCAAASSPPPTAWSASRRAAPWAAAAPSTGPTRC